jgi:hypothetical protein
MFDDNGQVTVTLCEMSSVKVPEDTIQVVGLKRNAECEMEDIELKEKKKKSEEENNKNVKKKTEEENNMNV